MFVFLFKHVLSDVWVVKASEIGQSDDNVHCKTHLGHLLNIGDSVLGYYSTYVITVIALRLS